MRRKQLQEIGHQQWVWKSWISQRWEVQMEVVAAVAAHEMLVVSAVAGEEVGWVPKMQAVMEALMAEVVEAEAQDLLAE